MEKKLLKLDPRNPKDVTRGEEIAARVGKQYAGDPNVITVSLGLKVKGGVVQTDRLVLTFFVRDKLTIDELKAQGLTPIPEEIEGMPTDVEPTKMRALGKALPARRQRRDPLLGGIAIGNSNRQWRYGTLGCIVFDDVSGEAKALTNEHVLVHTNEGQQGDPVIQPAPPRLEDFIDLDFTPTCCPVGPIFFIELAGPVSGFLSWLAVIAGVVALSDERDPTRRGQDNTLPAPDERTIREIVDVNLEYPDFPIPGTPYRLNVDWNYTRQTTGTSYTYQVKETNTNPHILDQQILLTDKKIYARGDFVHLLAAILPPSAPNSSGGSTQAIAKIKTDVKKKRPCTSYHVIADLVPSDPSQSDRYHQVVLHPPTSAELKTLMKLFPKLQEALPHQEKCTNFHQVPPDNEFPATFVHDGLTFRHVSGNLLQSIDLMPAAQKDGLSEIIMNEEGIEVDLPFPSNWVKARVAQFTSSPMILTAFDNNGFVVSSMTGPSEAEVEHLLEVQGQGITKVLIKGGGGEGLLLELCFGRTIMGDYCLFYGKKQLDNLDPYGMWNTFLFVQTINDVSTGTKPEEAAKTIGGLPLTRNFVYAGEGSIPTYGSGCMFRPDPDGDFELHP
jgi:hypothetical protein